MAYSSNVSTDKCSKLDAPECKKTTEIDRAMQEHQSMINDVGEAANEISRRLSTVLAYSPTTVSEAAEGSDKPLPKLWEVLDDQTRQLRLVRVAIVDCLDRLEL